ncbi:hypothetical protein ACFOGJ_17365 [Marinibaculum pumilum]|uniref:Strictosidine synthase n=1 Tax=Marinibaculum pumilum TaxID=1766165 RepID=A0ABV7L3Y7_9PROT
MIGPLIRRWDSLLGRGEAAVTVPPLDGALRPNRALDEAGARLPLADVDDLAVADGRLHASAGAALHALGPGGAWTLCETFGAAITALAALDDGGLAIALAGGEVLIDRPGRDRRQVRFGRGAGEVTAMTATGTSLYVAIGSTRHGRDGWQRDLLALGRSGEIHRIDLASGEAALLADGLAYPAGLAASGTDLVFAEAWRHRLVRIDPAAPACRTVLYHDLPGYPGRIAAAGDGYWLSVFAPRSQLVEFVLREPAYRSRMVAEVPEPYWVVPKLRSGRSFYEPLQGGGVKHLGILKPWAPTMSYGLCVRLDTAFQPRASLHSRADGGSHGVTATSVHDGALFVAAQGDGVVLRLAGDTRAAA